MKILSIDPGFERVGVAILEKINGKEILLYSNCFKTSPELDFNKRLVLIGEEIEAVIKKWRPEALSIETLIFNTNQKTAMQVAEARGVVVYMASKNGLEYFEYNPLQIKIAITGYGRATKDQVGIMTKNLIKIKDDVKSDDELDAIAIGLTYFASNKTFLK